MPLYQVMTSKKETQAIPEASYIVSAKNEEEAITILFKRVREGKIKPSGYLSRFSVPDYTCAARL